MSKRMFILQQFCAACHQTPLTTMCDVCKLPAIVVALIDMQHLQNRNDRNFGSLYYANTLLLWLCLPCKLLKSMQETQISAIAHRLPRVALTCFNLVKKAIMVACLCAGDCL